MLVLRACARCLVLNMCSSRGAVRWRGKGRRVRANVQVASLTAASAPELCACAAPQLDRERQRCSSYQHELKVVKERNFAVQKQVRPSWPMPARPPLVGLW